MAVNYIYRPLDRTRKEIRILVPQGKRDGIHQYSLRHVSLSNHSKSTAPFDAISYTWGDAAAQETIEIDDTPVSIPRNSFLALLDIERIHSDATFQSSPDSDKQSFAIHALRSRPAVWMDAICINQQDYGERDNQVQLMKDIYTVAHSVLIWLGEDQGQAADAFQCISRLLTELLFDTMQGHDFVPVRYDRFGRKHNRLTPQRRLPENIDWSALNWMFSLPWFSRIWTIQEAALNETVWAISGSNICKFDTPRFCCVLLTQYDYHEQNPYGKIRGIDLVRFRQEISSGEETRDRLEALLERAMHFDATNPKDLVFGMTALFSEQSIEILQPSYSHSLRKVYARATIASIVESGLLTALTKAANGVPPQASLDIDSDLPTWAIKCHWRWPGDPAVMPSKVHSARRLDDLRQDWYASLLPEMMAECDWRILPVLGVVMGEIDYISPVFDPDLFVDHPRLLAYLQDAQSRYKATKEEPFVEDIRSALRFAQALSDFGLMELTYNDSVDEYNGASFEDVAAGFAAGLWTILKKAESPIAEPNAELIGVYSHMLNYGMWNRRFFTSRSGMCGRVPPGAQIGDRICELMGGEVTFVLRQDSNTHWRLIGDCSVPSVSEEYWFRPKDEHNLLYKQSIFYLV